MTRELKAQIQDYASDSIENFQEVVNFLSDVAADKAFDLSDDGDNFQSQKFWQNFAKDLSDLSVENRFQPIPEPTDYYDWDYWVDNNLEYNV